VARRRMDVADIKEILVAWHAGGLRSPSLLKQAKRRPKSCSACFSRLGDRSPTLQRRVARRTSGGSPAVTTLRRTCYRWVGPATR